MFTDENEVIVYNGSELQSKMLLFPNSSGQHVKHNKNISLLLQVREG